jgi:hypothetical protein
METISKIELIKQRIKEAQKQKMLEAEQEKITVADLIPTPPPKIETTFETSNGHNEEIGEEPRNVTNNENQRQEEKNTDEKPQAIEIETHAEENHEDEARVPNGVTESIVDERIPSEENIEINKNEISESPISERGDLEIEEGASIHSRNHPEHEIDQKHRADEESAKSEWEPLQATYNFENDAVKDLSVLDIEENQDNENSQINAEEGGDTPNDSALSEEIIAEPITILEIDKKEEINVPSDLVMIEEENTDPMIIDKANDNIITQENLFGVKETISEPIETERQHEEALPDPELAKRPMSSQPLVLPPVQKKFKLNTSSYTHDCNSIGLQCPDLSTVGRFFETLSQCNILHKKLTLSEEWVNQYIHELESSISLLAQDGQFKEIYIRELLYILKSILIFNQYKVNPAFAYMCAAMLTCKHLSEDDVNRIFGILTSSNFFECESTELNHIFILENQGLVSVVVKACIEETDKSTANFKFNFLNKLVSKSANRFTIIQRLSETSFWKMFEDKFVDLLFSFTDMSALKHPECPLLGNLIQFALHPKAKLRFCGSQMIYDYIQDLDRESISALPVFKDLVFFIFLNKVYNSVSTEFSPEISVKSTWNLVGKSLIKDALFEHNEEFLDKYVEQYEQSVRRAQNTPALLSEADTNDIYDFQLSLLIAVMELYRTSLSDDNLISATPKALEFIELLLKNENPRIDLSRLIKCLNTILEDFLKRDFSASALPYFGRLPRILEDNIKAFMSTGAMNHLEKTIQILTNSMYKTIFTDNEISLLLDALPAEEKDLFAIIVYENIGAYEGNSQEILDIIKALEISLVDSEMANSTLFARIQKLENCRKFKILFAQGIKAKIGDVIIQLEQTQQVPLPIIWCRDELLEALKVHLTDESSDTESTHADKIRTLLTNFNQC